MDLYYKARMNVITMLQSRKYRKSTPDGTVIMDDDGLDLSTLTLSPEEFSTIFDRIDSGKLDITGLYDMRPSTPRKVYVKFVSPSVVLSDKSVFMEIIKPIAEHFEIPVDPKTIIDRLGHYKVIIIYNNEIKEDKYDASSLEDKWSHKFEFFEIHRLQYNPTKHSVLLPNYQYELLSGAELVDIRREFERKKMVAILKGDATNRYFDGQVGDIYKISRGADGITFRIVVPGTIKLKKKK